MAQILKSLRNLMKIRNLQMYFLPRTDEHQSEYLVPSDERIQFISGFSGSNALTLISENEAFLWTDGRYLLQAQKQLRTDWKLMKMIQGEKKWYEYAADIANKNKTIGFDPRLITAQNGIERTNFFQQKGLQFQSVHENLVDLIWNQRSIQTKPQIYSHEVWAGRSMSEKINWVRDQIKSKNGESAIFNDLSEIAWLTNLRSSQIPHNPFFKSILIVTLTGGTVYLPCNNTSLTNPLVIQHLLRQNIEMKPYQPIFDRNSLIVKSQLNYFIYDSIKDKNPIQWEGIGMYRAIKTDKQIQGYRRCHISDGIALAKFWTWRSKKQSINQYEAAQYIDNLRYKQDHNRGLSFDTISGGGPNGAIIHYRPTASCSQVITKDMIHLLDSGGQYLDGTTDVTRAFHFGCPTSDQKDSYTRVLLGNIDLERLVFPAGKLTGADIDILARRHLWKNKKDYLHSTGHGVGYFGGVHQGPVSISRLSKTKFQSGMVVTNEPGYYETGKYGIRIQNMLLVHQKEGFNYFQNFTLCPYDKNLIQKSLLTAADIEFVDNYHKKVWEKLSPNLINDTQTLEWLRRATSPL